jgi:hypothetical protein
MHASTAGGPDSADQTIVRFAERALQAALEQQTRPIIGMFIEPSAHGTAAIDGAVRQISAQAQVRGLRPEQMLVAVKQAWAHLAPIRARHLGDRDADVLRQVVTISIEHYFEDRSEIPGN